MEVAADANPFAFLNDDQAFVQTLLDLGANDRIRGDAGTAAAPLPLDEEEEVIKVIDDHSPNGDLVIEVEEGSLLPDQNGAA